jgi:hypothetical protein
MELEQPPIYTAKISKICTSSIIDVPPPPYIQTIQTINIQNVSSIQPIQTVVVIPKALAKALEDHKSHLCMCERGCIKVIDCCFCFPDDNYSNRNNRATCKNLADFRVYCGSDDDGYCLGVLCFPISLFRKLIFELPCVSYNFCRNKCNGTKDLNYMC